MKKTIFIINQVNSSYRVVECSSLKESEKQGRMYDKESKLKSRIIQILMDYSKNNNHGVIITLKNPDGEYRNTIDSMIDEIMKERSHKNIDEEKLRSMYRPLYYTFMTDSEAKDDIIKKYI